MRSEKVCKSGGEYVVWKSKRDIAFVCDRHMGYMIQQLVETGDLKKPVQVAFAPPYSEAPCLYCGS